MAGPTRKEIKELKKQLEAEDKKNDAIMAKLTEAKKNAEALKAAAAKTKTELGKETD